MTREPAGGRWMPVTFYRLAGEPPRRTALVASLVAALLGDTANGDRVDVPRRP